MPFPQKQQYTIDDIFNLPAGTRAELIDGPVLHSFSDIIKVNIYSDLGIDFSKLQV